MLVEEKRKQLDSIVSQMASNGEKEDTIQFVVNDFKNKYSTEESETPFLEKTSKALDTIFVGGALGKALGIEAARFGLTGLSEEQRKEVGARPSLKEI